MTDTKKAPNPVDVYVGSRVRMRRMMLSISQEKLGVALGLTFQQVQKYERGANRIGSSRMQQIALALHTPIPWFFQGLPNADGSEAATIAADDQTIQRVLASREGVRLVLAFDGVTDAKVRRSLVELVEGVAEVEDEKPNLSVVRAG